MYSCLPPILAIMSKFVKVILICGYALVLIQYLRISLAPVTEEIDIEYIIRSEENMAKRDKLAKKLRRNFTAYLQSFKKPMRFKSDYKYILKYTNSFLHYETPWYKNGQTAFIHGNCTYYNCYVTNQKSLLNDYRDYDAILFDVENSWDGPLIIREPYQKFIFVATESAAHYPLCDDFYDHYYNLTWSYRLDSDIKWSYLSILDMNDNVVGPNINMSWIQPMKPTPIEVKKKLGSKHKAAAWFVSNCNHAGGRQSIAKAIEKALQKYKLKVDIYGWCGRLKCPKDRQEECLSLLESDYYFYFAFENSLSEDYVTEKVLYPLQNYAVPIVYGGANYSRFLPPGSYIDAKKLNATEVAEEMYNAIKHPSVYEQYFRWHNYYKYIKNSPTPELCELCRILNEEADKRSVIKYFRQWWNPDFFSLCTKGVGRFLVMNPNHFGALDVDHINKKQNETLNTK